MERQSEFGSFLSSFDQFMDWIFVVSAQFQVKKFGFQVASKEMLIFCSVNLTPAKEKSKSSPVSVWV